MNSTRNTESRFAEAEPLYKRALAIWEKAPGPDHPDVATSLNNLAAHYHDQGKYVDTSVMEADASRYRGVTWPKAWRTTPPCYARPDGAPRQQGWKSAPRRSGLGTQRKIRRTSECPLVARSRHPARVC